MTSEICYRKVINNCGLNINIHRRHIGIKFFIKTKHFVNVCVPFISFANSY